MPSKTHMRRQLTAPEKLDDRMLMTASPLAPPAMDPVLIDLIQETVDQFDDIAIAQAPIDALMEEIGRERDAKGEWNLRDDDLEQQSLDAQGHQQTIDDIINGYQSQINDLIVHIGTVQDAIHQRTGDITQAQNERNALQPTWEEVGLQLSSQLFSLRDSLARIGGELTRLGKTVTPQIEKLIPELYPKEIGRAVDMAYALRSLTSAQIAQWQDTSSPSAAMSELLAGALLTWQKGSVQETIIHQAEHLDGIIVQLASDQQRDQQTIDHLNQDVTSLRTSIEEQQNAWNSLAETINNLANARAEIPNQIAAIDTVIGNLWNDIDDKTNLREAEENEAIAAEEALLMALETRVLKCAPPDITPVSDVDGLRSEGDALLARTQNIRSVLQDLQAAEPVIWSDGGKSRLTDLKQRIGDDAFALTLDTQDWQERSGRAVDAVTSPLDEGIDPSVLLPLSIAPVYADEPTELEQLLKIPTALAAPLDQGLQLLTNRSGMQIENVDESIFVNAVSQELSMAESVAAWTLEDGYPVKKKPARTEFDFTAFDGVPIPQGQNFGGGPRVAIPDIGLVEAYSNELGLTFQDGALIVTRSAAQGTMNSDVFGYALREGDPQAMRVTITYTGTTPATLHFGIADQPGTDAHMDLEQGTHTYELPKKASYVEVHSQDGRLTKIDHIELFDPFLKAPGRNRPMELAAHAVRVTDVMSALQYLAQHVADLRTQGLLPASLAHLPKEIANRIALLGQEGSDVQALQQAFEELPWGSLSPASMASLFPKEGMQDDLSLSVMDFSGPAVTVAFRDPGFPTIVEIDHGAGMMGRRTAERSDAGGGMCMVQVSMDRAAPAGTYQIRILDPQTADKVIGTMNIVWDGATMRLGDGATMFVPQTYRQDDGVMPYGDMILQTLNDEGAVLTAGDEFTTRMRIAASMEEAFITVGAFEGPTNYNIMTVERDKLEAALSSFYPELHSVTTREFDQAFYDFLPQWRQENEVQTRTLYRWDHVSFVESRSAEWNRLSHDVGNYNAGIRDMIAEAFNVAAMLRQGRAQEAETLTRTMQTRYDNRLAVPEMHMTAPHFMVFVEACCNVVDQIPIDVMDACYGAETETARLNYQAFVSPSYAGDGTEVVKDARGNPVTDASGNLVYQQTIDYSRLSNSGVDASEARNLVHIAGKNLEHFIAVGAPPEVIASMQNQQTLAMANYNIVLGGGTVLTFQQQNQQNILAAIAEGAPQGRQNALAYLQENGLPIPTSAYDDFFASKEGLDYILTHMDLDDATNALVATGWLRGKADGVRVAMEDLEQDLEIGGIAWHEATQFPDVQQFEKSAVMAEFLEHVPQNGGIAFGNSYLSFETLAGRILYGFTNKVPGNNQREQMEFCAKMEAVLGIPAQSFMRALLLDSPTKQQERLTGLLASYGMKTSITEPAQWPMEDDLESFILDGAIAEGQTMRVYWNVQPHGKTVSHTGVYLIYARLNAGENVQDEAIVDFTRDQLYLDIPYSALQQHAATDAVFALKVVTWYEGELGDEPNWERDFSIPDEKVRVVPNLLRDIAVPEGSLDLRNATPLEDYKISDGGQFEHLGEDYPAPEGTPVIWTGPAAKVLSIESGHGYGTMLVRLELDFEAPVTFENEVDPSQYATNQEVPAVTVTTSKVIIILGHLRPSRERVESDSEQERREIGESRGEISLQVGSVIHSGTVVGYLESKEYGGESTGSHVHEGAFNGETLDPYHTYKGRLSSDELTSINRSQWIKPEKMWASFP